MIPRYLLRVSVFIWLLTALLTGLTAGIGYVLSSGEQMVYTHMVNTQNAQFMSLILKDMSRNLESRLTDYYGINAVAKWSPDGQQIAYLSFNGEQFEVYVMDALGQHKHHIPLEFTGIGGGVWSPDSKRILYSITVQGQSQSVVVNAATGQTNILPQDIPLATWSPDSQTVIYRKLTKNDSGLYGLNIQCFDQSQPCEFKKLEILQNQPIVSLPVWSPDGKSVAFATYKQGHSKIVVAALRCTNLVESCVDHYDVIGETNYFQFLIWSADSKSLAYVGTQSEIDVAHLETGAIRSFTMTSGLSVPQNWSPSGRFIIFLSTQPATNLYILDTVSGESHILFPNPDTDGDPHWRPTPH